MAAGLAGSVKLERHAGLALVSDTPKGRGVFATNQIPAGAIIDICPVLVLSAEDSAAHVANTSLYHYTYNWPATDADGRKQTAQAVVLGLGSMFNHSRDQNVGWRRDEERLLVTYTALREIASGEELCISYGDRLTFADADNRSQSAKREMDEDSELALRAIEL